MSNIAIHVENLSKQYRITAARRPPDTLREQLMEGLTSVFRRNGYRSRQETFWALKDVSFEIKHGEVVGIIGRNGAGKSTLLKILSRITEPTSGYARLYGRVGSLLEVGTGFDRELTGRENIYLNAAILGMKRAEINRKFDEIVTFAETEKFIDTPVKRYSSGMYVRLAFAVAAYMEPEILLVDEVLAVGDVAFQKKCLGKMGDVAREGRTVLFVSHSMQTISLLCPSVILLEDGRVAARGSTSQVVAQHLSSTSNQSAEALWLFEEAPGTSTARLRSVRALNEKDEPCFSMWMNEAIILRAEIWILGRIRVDVSFHVYNQQGVLLFATGSFHDVVWRCTDRRPGLYACSCTIPKHYLNEGLHYVMIYVHHSDDHIVDVEIPEVISFNVEDPGDTRGGWTGPWIGLVRPILPWKVERIGEPL